MPVWGWVLVAVLVALAAGAIGWAASSRRRTTRLRGRFGPEYDRTVETADSRRDAESELAEREARRERLQIRPLPPAARARYLERWQSVQAEFVDSPDAAVTSADSLIQSVMAERGYPVEDFEQRAADVSVDPPHVVEHYRAGHSLATAGADGEESTESLRQAMRHYRALFADLVEDDDGAAAANGSRSPAREGVVRR
jgi:hypothetical protein